MEGQRESRQGREKGVLEEDEPQYLGKKRPWPKMECLGGSSQFWEATLRNLGLREAQLEGLPVPHPDSRLSCAVGSY